MHEEEFQAVLIRRPPSERNRLYCEVDSSPRLWPLHSRGPAEVCKLLMVNGITAEVIEVTLKTTKGKPE